MSELVIGPTLGRDTIRRGMWAMVLSAFLVFAFMLVYYRFCRSGCLFRPGADGAFDFGGDDFDPGCLHLYPVLPVWS